MAKIKLSSVLKGISGHIGGLVIKKYGNKFVASKYPDMSRVKRSPAQKEMNERMKWANGFYKGVLLNPKFHAHYARRAKAKRTTIHRLVTKDYLALAKQHNRTDVYRELEAKLLRKK